MKPQRVNLANLEAYWQTTASFSNPKRPLADTLEGVKWHTIQQVKEPHNHTTITTLSECTRFVGDLPQQYLRIHVMRYDIMI